MTVWANKLCLPIFNINQANLHVIVANTLKWLRLCLSRHITSQWCDVSIVSDHRCSHLIQSPVSAQGQQIIVLSLQNLTCLRNGKWKKEKKQKTHIIFTTPAIFSGMVTEAADAFRYSHCISILLEYRWAAKIHRAACQGDSWQICMFWFRFHQLLKADTDIPLFLDWRWWQMIFLPIFSTFKFSYINAKGNFKKFCGKMAPSQWGFSIFTMENLGVAFRHLI